MKTKEKRQAARTGKRNAPAKKTAKKRIRERALNEDEMQVLTNDEVEEDVDRDVQDRSSGDRKHDRDIDVEGDEQRAPGRRRIEELNDDEAIY